MTQGKTKQALRQAKSFFASAASGTRTALTVLVDIFKLKAWALIVLLAIVLFYRPANEILSAVPTLVANSDSTTLEIGSFKIAVARAKATVPVAAPDVSAAIAKLDKAMMEELLHMELKTSYCAPLGDSEDELRIRNVRTSLLDRQLVEKTDQPNDKDCPVMHKLNDLGRRTHEYLLDALTTLITVGKAH